MANCFYHYTDAQTALKILDNNELWMTHVSYLNDSTEGKELRKILNRMSVPSGVYNILDYIDKNYESYVCSFSEKGDLLSQWRGYCPNGEGYAIGFKQPESYKNLFDDEGICFRGAREDGNHLTHTTVGYQPCIYQKKDKQDVIKALALKLQSSYESMPTNVKNLVANLPKRSQEWIKVYSYLIQNEKDKVWFNDYIFFKYCFKNESFKEENEYRLFITFNERYHQEPCYRVKNGVFIPYYRFCFDDNLIKEIIVRKTRQQELSKAGLKHYLKHRKGKNDEEIKKLMRLSKIPFRE
ncbi:DUF2971 domain-containing protein [Alteromonadaceae bacterium BrNp21-10]|nr:DUF2971 domain-containing protein [Alteromonadaceae bacterium BrNp21-10]